MKNFIKPKARVDQLVFNQLADELLIYDLKSHQAYCLNAAAAAVWNLCDGSQTTTELAAKLNNREAGAANEAVVSLALEELEKFDLLASSSDQWAEKSPAKKLMTRREAVRTFGTTAAVLPVITMLVVPTAAQSASLQANGTACLLSEQCASGCCDTNVCVPVDVCGLPRRSPTRRKSQK